jgi:hypothetical protein
MFDRSFLSGSPAPLGPFLAEGEELKRDTASCDQHAIFQSVPTAAIKSGQSYMLAY